MEYVYKYLNDRGDVVYVGITNNMTKRTKQHETDKLSNIRNPLIFYFPVMYRGDAELLETYLINHYRTGNGYNVSKTKKGDFSFLDICDELPWVRYDGHVDEKLKPFKVSVIRQNDTVVEERIVYKDCPKGFEGNIQMIDEHARQMVDFYDDEISCEKEIIKKLEDLLTIKESKIVKRGLELHRKKLIALEVASRDPYNMDISSESIQNVRAAKEEVEEFERRIQNDRKGF